MISNRFGVLDGWRGISILIVLACHLLPLGPKPLLLNFSAGLLGMALFFTLSGFLVTHFLLYRQSLVDFLIRRLFRILPLAWLYMFIVFMIYPETRDIWTAHFLFYANYPPKPLIPRITEHMWSLCVEMHFYLGVVLLVALLKRKGLLLLPLICLVITVLRISAGKESSIITHFRVDEILTGATLALIYDGRLGTSLQRAVSKSNLWVVLVLLLVSCHPHAGFMNYLRPYLAALLVGITLFNPHTRISAFLENRYLFYIASISYALYVIHPLLAATWLGSGEGVVKYMKRPLLFMAIFATAHVSTFYYEQKWMAWGKMLTKKVTIPPPVKSA